MESETRRGYEQEFEERFAWRKARQIDNLKELSEIAQSGGAGALKEFPGLQRTHDDRVILATHKILEALYGSSRHL